MIDRLVNHDEIIALKGESYRRKEAQERAAAKSTKRKAKGEGHVAKRHHRFDRLPSTLNLSRLAEDRKVYEYTRPALQRQGRSMRSAVLNSNSATVRTSGPQSALARGVKKRRE
ncbi:MAG: hypothetical protein ACK4KV_10390 [Rhodocyclaceae bacterium]